MTTVGFTNGNFVADTLAFLAAPTPDDQMDFYEKGTFSCNVGGSAVAGTPTYNSNGSVARFERIGKRVWISILHSWNALAGAAGNLAAIGLPYQSANLTGSEVNLHWVMATQWGVLVEALASGAGEIPGARVSVNSNRVDLTTYDLAGGTHDPFAVIGNGSYFINGFYEVD